MASISKRGKTWQTKVSYYDDNGDRKWVTKGGFRTKAEASVYVTDIEKHKNDGDLKIDNTMLFADYFWNWFETYKESSVRDRTKLTYESAHHILQKYIPDAVIGKLNRRSYQLFIKNFGATHSKATVSKINSLYHASVKDAIYDGIVKKDFIENVTLVFDKKRTRAIRYLNVEELKVLIDYLLKTRNPHFTSKYMILTSLYTGMRPGEVGGLKWQDINFNFKTFTLKQSWNESTKDFEPLKNDSSYRTIRVNQSLLDVLKELPRDDKMGRVFANQYATIPTSSAVNTVLKKSLTINGIKREGFHFHSCRHTHVAYLLSQGIDLYAISKRLGHADMVTTGRIYAYLIDEYKAKTDEQITKSLENLNNKNSNSKNQKA